MSRSLDDLRLLIADLRYGEMVQLANELWSHRLQMVETNSADRLNGLVKDEFAPMVHAWAMSRAGGPAPAEDNGNENDSQFPASVGSGGNGGSPYIGYPGSGRPSGSSPVPSNNGTGIGPDNPVRGSRVRPQR